MRRLLIELLQPVWVMSWLWFLFYYGFTGDLLGAVVGWAGVTFILPRVLKWITG